MEENWVKIYTTTDTFTAEIIKQGLQEEDIPAVVINKQLAAYNFGEIEIMVNKAHFDSAIEYLVRNGIE